MAGSREGKGDVGGGEEEYMLRVDRQNYRGTTAVISKRPPGQYRPHYLEVGL